MTKRLVTIESEFSDFIVATILADLFDPENNDDIDIVTKKIADGLLELDMIEKDKNIEPNQFSESFIGNFNDKNSDLNGENKLAA